MTCNRWPMHTDLRAVQASVRSLAEAGNTVARRLLAELEESEYSHKLDREADGFQVEVLVVREREMYSVLSLFQAFASMATVVHPPVEDPWALVPVRTGAGAGAEESGDD